MDLPTVRLEPSLESDSIGRVGCCFGRDQQQRDAGADQNAWVLQVADCGARVATGRSRSVPMQRVSAAGAPTLAMG